MLLTPAALSLVLLAELLSLSLSLLYDVGVAGGVAVQHQDAWVGELECSFIMSRRCDADMVSMWVVAVVIQYV
jgi:hypothetical protein